MTSKSQILIVDDDKGIRELLSQFLQQHGFDTYGAKNGEQMRANLQSYDISLIILDIMLPGEDGISLCQSIRKTSQIPIIMLTAITEDVEHILALEVGADDFINKPFNPRTLLARIKALLRRANPSDTIETKEPKHRYYLFQGWKLDSVSRRLTSPEQLDISLSSGEYTLLRAFVERPQHVLSRDHLLDLTKHREAGPYDRSIDIQISRLRHKIEQDPKHPQLIKTVRGGGYILATTVTRQ
jgi:two-component system, OmpR family, response regulator